MANNIPQWKVGDILSASKLNAMVDAINTLISNETEKNEVYITLDELNQILEQYSDVGHTHSINEIVDLVLPTKLSQLQNDTSYVTEDYVTDAIADAQLGGDGEVDLTDYAKTSDIPTKTSQLTNDSDFVNKSYVAAEIANVSVGGNAAFRDANIREVFTCTLPDNFTDCSAISIYNGSTTTGSDVKLQTEIQKCPNNPEIVTITTTDNMRSNKSELIFTRNNYYVPQVFYVKALAPGTGQVTVSAPNGYTNTATFTITGDAIEDIVTLTSIDAVYTQGTTVVYPNTSLNDLKTGLVVTANYSDGSTETITDYTLSGTLSVGTSVVTVTFNDKTDTFDVVVTDNNVVEGEYITDGLTHMVDFTSYSIGHTGDIIDTVTNQTLLANNLDQHTTGRIGFVEEGCFSPGIHKESAKSVSAYIPSTQIGTLVYPITLECYVRLRTDYDPYQPDGTRAPVSTRSDRDIMSTRDTESQSNGVNGIWVRYLQANDVLSVIETLNNTNIVTTEGYMNDKFAYNETDFVWTHITAVFGTDDKRLYVNGEKVAQGEGTTIAPNKACVIGFINFDWKMFRMYNKALTDNEIQHNYNTTITTMGGN